MIATTIVSHLFELGVPVAEKVIRTAAVYAGILILIRLGGKRELAQVNSFDLVVLLLLSNVVQNAVIGPDDSLVGGLLGAAVLLGINAIVVRVARLSRRADLVLEGAPTNLMVDGRLNHAALVRLGLRETDVINAIRRQGASTLDEVQEAVMMPGGAILVTLKPEFENATKADIARLEATVQEMHELLERATRSGG